MSEDSGWSKPDDGKSTSLLSYMSSDWPVMPPTSLGVTEAGVLSNASNVLAIHPQDNLQTVLEKLGLGKYYHIFQVCPPL